MLSPPNTRAAAGCAGLLAALATLGACGGGSTLNLGAEAPIPYHFGQPRALTELGKQPSDNPTLTGDLLEIFFTSNRDNVSIDVWTAKRASTAVPFDAPVLVSAASTPSFETSSAISTDGLTLWFGSDRPGGLGDLDIWMIERPTRDGAWSAPVDLLKLNSTSRDLPRPLGLHNRVMPLSSQRDNPIVYWTYFSTRTSADAFSAPVSIPELSFSQESTVDAFLTDDGLALFYSSSLPEGMGDIYVAWRRSTSDPFTLSATVDELNTPHAERDPWLSQDGTTFYFTSDRSGISEIYEVAVTRM